MKKLILTFLIILVASPAFGLAVFPGAEGYGADTVAGRGGTVYKVTNLNTSGAGSLHACMEASGARVCIFEVSGTIEQNGYIDVSDQYLTVAGQTAPDPGITLKGATVRISAPDVLIQHIRFRVGDQSGVSATVRDNMGINREIGSVPITNVVIDHCSFSWSVDGQIDIRADDVTISNCIFGEALKDSLHPEGDHSFSSLTDLITDADSSKRNPNGVAFIKNLWLHATGRNPYIKAFEEAIIVNNVAYNFASYEPYQINASSSDPVTLDVVVEGNVAVSGADSSLYDSRGKILNVNTRVETGSVIYADDNDCANYSSSYMECIQDVSTGSPTFITTPTARPTWPSGGVTVLAASATQAYVLANSGARPADRDTVDTQLVLDVTDVTGEIIDCVETTYPAGHDESGACAKNAGGWPVLAENTRGLTVPDNPGSDDDADGYTNLEEWLYTYSVDATISGTCTDTISESTMRAAGCTYVITLSGVEGVEWVATAGDDNAITTAIINGVTGWGDTVTYTHAAVTRTSGTVLTVVVPAQAAYSIDSQATVSAVMPATSVTSIAGVDANNSFTIDPITATTSGSCTSSVTEDTISGSGCTYVITLTDETWVATIGADNGITTAFIAGVTGWGDTVTYDYTAVTRTSATVLTVVVPLQAAYDITKTETVSLVIPATALTGALETTSEPSFTVDPVTPAIPGANQSITYSVTGITITFDVTAGVIGP